MTVSMDREVKRTDTVWPKLSEAEVRQLLSEMRVDENFVRLADSQALEDALPSVLARVQGLSSPKAMQSSLIDPSPLASRC